MKQNCQNTRGEKNQQKSKHCFLSKKSWRFKQTHRYQEIAKLGVELQLPTSSSAALETPLGLAALQKVGCRVPKPRGPWGMVTPAAPGCTPLSPPLSPPAHPPAGGKHRDAVLPQIKRLTAFTSVQLQTAPELQICELFFLFTAKSCEKWNQNLAGTA